MSIVEQVRDLIASPAWKTMDFRQQGSAIKAIDDDADVYSVSYLDGNGTGSTYTVENFPSYDEAAERAMAIFQGALPLYAGSYVEVIDFGGENLLSMYVR